MTRWSDALARRWEVLWPRNVPNPERQGAWFHLIQQRLEVLAGLEDGISTALADGPRALAGDADAVRETMKTRQAASMKARDAETRAASAGRVHEGTGDE